MKSIFLMAILFTSTVCLSQNYFDTLVFNFVDSIWKTSVVRSAPILHLDSSKIDLYKRNAPHVNKELRMKFGYVQDSTGIYVFEIISSDLERLLCDTCQVIPSQNYPPQTFFKLNYIFDGSALKRYNTYEMLSGFGKEYPLFLESKVDYAYKGFNLPFVVNAEVMYIIVQKINLPNDLEQINLLIKTEVPEISYTEFECFSDSIYSLKIHNKDSILVGEFSILPVSLSVEKLDEFEYWAYISSCFIGLLNPKIIRYKNFIFRPSCGFNRLIDKELIDKFYAALESVQTE